MSKYAEVLLSIIRGATVRNIYSSFFAFLLIFPNKPGCLPTLHVPKFAGLIGQSSRVVTVQDTI